MSHNGLVIALVLSQVTLWFVTRDKFLRFIAMLVVIAAIIDVVNA